MRRLLAIALSAIAVALAIGAGPAAAAPRHCAPVVTSAGPGYTKATVLIVTGRVDCEKSRNVIWQALSTSSYAQRQIRGWDCASTSRGSSGVFGARCETEGEKGLEVVKSTVPRRCPGCHKIKN